jgi:hypothetical protein
MVTVLVAFNWNRAKRKEENKDNAINADSFGKEQLQQLGAFGAWGCSFFICLKCSFFLRQMLMSKVGVFGNGRPLWGEESTKEFVAR